MFARRSFVERLNGDAHLVRHGIHFSERFPSRLAGIVGDDSGEVIAILFEKFRERQSDFDAHFPPCGSPLTSRTARRGDSEINFRRRSVSSAPTCLARRRVDRRQGFPIARNRFTVDPMTHHLAHFTLIYSLRVPLTSESSRLRPKSRLEHW